MICPACNSEDIEFPSVWDDDGDIPWLHCNRCGYDAPMTKEQLEESLK